MTTKGSFAKVWSLPMSMFKQTVIHSPRVGLLREGSRKKNPEKVWSFAKPRVNKKPNLKFGNVFFQ